jgi:hypothetical protein
MKYRIITTTYKNGRKTYLAQVKKGWFWISLYSDGSTDLTSSYDVESRILALSFIDKHFNGNTKKQTIEFEYINK